jgi:large subunit ribosomal protein L10
MTKDSRSFELNCLLEVTSLKLKGERLKMTRQEKQELVANLTDSFKTSNAIVVCNYKGLTVKQLESLRKVAREKEVNVQVIKNKLASLAVKNCEIDGFDTNGTNIFLWSEDQISACKVADNFAKEVKENFEIKSGIIEGEVADKAKVETFAKLPGREELLGMLGFVWMAPLTNFVTGLDNLKKKKEEEAE